MPLLINLANRAVIALEKGADALVRQADVMETDVEAELRDPNEEIVEQATRMIHSIGHRLEEIVTTSDNAFGRAQKTRQLIEEIKAVELSSKDEQEEA